MRILVVTLIALSACQVKPLEETPEPGIQPPLAAQSAAAESAAAGALAAGLGGACVEVLARREFGPSSGNSRAVCLLDADGDGALDAFHPVIVSLEDMVILLLGTPVAKHPYLSCIFGVIGDHHAALPTGAQVLDRLLLSLSGARDLPFGVSYNSLQNTNESSLAKGWSHNFEKEIVANGSAFEYHATPNLVYSFEPIGSTGFYDYVHNDMRHHHLEINADDSLILHFPNQTTFLFSSALIRK